MPLAADSRRLGRRWAGNCARGAVGRGIAVARLVLGMNHAGANAQRTDPRIRININLYLCFSVLMNLAQAAVPESFAVESGDSRLARQSGHGRSVSGKRVYQDLGLNLF